MEKRAYLRTSVYLASVWLILLIFGVNAFGQGNLKLGRLSMTPALKYELRYDDNVFIESTNEQDDTIHIITPSILFGYTGATPGNYFQAGYTGDFALYTDLTDNNWQRHSPFASFGYESPKGFYVQLSDNFSWSKDPFGSFTDFDQSNRFGLGTNTERYDNTGKVLGGYHFSDRWFVETYYQNFLIRYDLDKDAWQDRIDNGFSGALFYRFTPKTSVFVEYRGTKAEYDEQNDGIFDVGRDTFWSSDTSQDYWLHDALVGVRFEPGGKISGEAKVGYGKKDFDNSVDVLGNEYKDAGDLIFNSFLTYTPTQRTTVSLNAQRSPLGSPDADAPSFVNTLVQLSLTQGFAYGLSGHLLGGWNYDDYQDENPGVPNKYFNRYTVRIGLDWAIKSWIKVGVGYEYEDQQASDEAAFGTSEYSVNRAKFIIAGTW